MSVEAIKNSVVEINTVFEEYKKANHEALAQKADKGYVDAALQEKMAKMDSAIDHAEKALEKAERAEVASKRIAVVEESKNQLNDEEKHIKELMFNYIKKGISGLNPAQQDEYYNYCAKSMNAFVGSDGGYAVTPDINRNIIEIVRETSPMRQYAEVLTIGTDRLEQPFERGDIDAGWVGELEARPETNTPSLGMQSWEVHEVYAQPAATQKIINDAFFDIQAYLTSKAADKFSRMENTAFLVGNGVKQPRGLLTYAATDPTQIDQIQQVASGIAGGFNYNSLVDLTDALKPFYQPGAVFLMKRSTMSLIRKTLDTTGNPIFVPPTLKEPGSVFGYPIVYMDDMPAAASGSLSIVFGNLRDAYRIVDRQGVSLLVDPYTNKPFIRFYMTKRVGGALKNGDAVKIMKFSVS